MDEQFMKFAIERLNQIAALSMDARDRSIRNELTLQKNTDDIAEHIRRTNALEEKVDTVEADVKTLKMPFVWLSRSWDVIKWVGGAVILTAGVYKAGSTIGWW